MSTNKYCTACGTKHVIGLTPVKFCSNCGNPFEIVASVAPKPQPVVTRVPSPIQSNNIDAPAGEDFQLPQINASDFITDAPPKRITIGDLKDTSLGGARGEASSPKLTPEQARANFERMFVKEREQNTDSTTS